MVRQEQTLANYIELVTGLRPRFEPTPPASALPLFVRQQYNFAATELFGRRVVLAIEKTRPEELSATEYARNAAMSTYAFSGIGNAFFPALFEETVFP